MNSKTLTDAELLLLGLVAEMPRHGYELEQVIEDRGMREWTQIGFSSIYFVLGKLEKSGLVMADAPAGKKARKVFSATHAGRDLLEVQSLDALRDVRPNHASVLLGMAHWPLLAPSAAQTALSSRSAGVAAEIERLERIRLQRQPLPDFVEALFDYAVGQLQAEMAWVGATLDYMKSRP